MSMVHIVVEQRDSRVKTRDCAGRRSSVGSMREHFDPWDPAYRSDPHTFWNDARERLGLPSAIGPVSGRRIWFPLRYGDAVSALRDPRLGKEPQKHLPDELVAPDMTAEGPFDVLGRNMLFLDPPDHTRLRRLVREPLSNRAISALEPQIRAIATDLVDRIDDEFDMVADFALPLPVRVIAALLGVPASDQGRFRAWTQAILGRGATEMEMMTAGMEFVQYLNELADERRAAPGEDLVSYLLTVEDAGERLDHQEFLAMVFLLLVAGHETTVNLIGNGTVELSRHPDEADVFASDPTGIVESAVEELVRFHGPVESATIRFAYEDIELGEARISMGDPVVVMLMAANRDPRQFPEPDRLDLRRVPNRHIGFGAGIHLCLGAPLARLEAAVAFRELFRRFPRFLEMAVDPADLRWTPDFFLRGAASIPVAARS